MLTDGASLVTIVGRGTRWTFESLECVIVLVGDLDTTLYFVVNRGSRSGGGDERASRSDPNCAEKCPCLLLLSA